MTTDFAATTRRRLAPISILVAVVALWTAAIVPLRLVGIGFRPRDDARRHVAKAIADKPWSDILVLRPEATVDPHPGWHALLGAIHRAGVRSPTALLVLSVVSLAALALALPLLLGVASGEAWLLSLTVGALAGWEFFFRVMLGRPLVVTIAVLLAVAAVWPLLREERLPRALWLALAAAFALSTWMHGNWYLWSVPLAGFVLAGELRAGVRLAAAVAAGTAVGAAATGHPVEFLRQTLSHPFWALASGIPRRLLVGEFQPSGGVLPMVAAVLGLVAWRHLRGRPLAPLVRDPVFLLVATGWALGLATRRFWWDWGMPACLVWMARELDDAIGFSRLAARHRASAVCVIAAVFFLAVTADNQNRWSRAERSAFLSSENPGHRPWLPDPGGILYSNSMVVFYDTFFKNPRAPWRYALGFEPGLMTSENLAVHLAVEHEGASDASFAPWVAKLRPEDRLIIVRRGDARPAIAALEWYSPYRGMWIGKRPRASQVPAPPGA